MVEIFVLQKYPHFFLAVSFESAAVVFGGKFCICHRCFWWKVLDLLPLFLAGRFRSATVILARSLGSAAIVLAVSFESAAVVFGGKFWICHRCFWREVLNLPLLFLAKSFNSATVVFSKRF